MAEYKIPQDVEADDKFVGPLSFKQSIYGGIAATCLYLSFISLTKGAPFLIVLFLPVILVAGFLAWPWSREQPTEIWLAARIRFMIKPRIRIWNQSGVKELVTITAPKLPAKVHTDGLTEIEVSSRLSGLADLLDSRGWAVKNAGGSNYVPILPQAQDDTDRLVAVDTAAVLTDDAAAANDVLDESSNQTAIHFEEMIKSSEERHHHDVLQQIEQARQPEPDQAAQAQNHADFWFAHKGGHQPTTDGYISELGYTDSLGNGTATFSAQSTIDPTQSTVSAQASTSNFLPPQSSTTASITPLDEQALLEKIHRMHDQQSNQNGHLKTIMPIGQQEQAKHHNGGSHGHHKQGNRHGDTAAANSTTGTDDNNASSNHAYTPINDDTPAGDDSAQPVKPWTPPPGAKHHTKHHKHQDNTHKQSGAQAPKQQVTPPVDPAIMSLANNNDLNVATLAREANKQSHNDGEVIISLR